MKRTTAPGHVSNHFSDGDPVNGILPTVMESTWANAVQEEICSVIEGASITLNPAVNTQLKAAIAAMIAAAAGSYASNAEAWAGTLSNKALVPSNFKNSFSDNDYLKLPGGFLLQWGFSNVAVTTEGIVTITFPIAFPSACLFATAQNRNTAGSNLYHTWTQNVARSASQYSFMNQMAPGATGPGTDGYDFFALGI